MLALANRMPYDLSKNRFRVVDEYGDMLIQKCISGPLTGGYIVTDKNGTLVSDKDKNECPVFFDKSQVFDFIKENDREEQNLEDPFKDPFDLWKQG